MTVPFVFGLATTVPFGDSGWNRHFFNSSNQHVPGHPPAKRYRVAGSIATPWRISRRRTFDSRTRERSFSAMKSRCSTQSAHASPCALGGGAQPHHDLGHALGGQRRHSLAGREVARRGRLRIATHRLGVEPHAPGDALDRYPGDPLPQYLFDLDHSDLPVRHRPLPGRAWRLDGA